MSDDPKKMLVLHVAVPDVWGDDLDEHAAYYAEPDEPTAKHRLQAVREWFRRDCIITLTTVPGEQMMGDEFSVLARDGRIVGAELRPR